MKHKHNCYSTEIAFSLDNTLVYNLNEHKPWFVLKQNNSHLIIRNYVKSKHEYDYNCNNDTINNIVVSVLKIKNSSNARLLTIKVFHKLTLLDGSQIRWWQLLLLLLKLGVNRVCGLLAAILLSTRVRWRSAFKNYWRYFEEGSTETLRPTLSFPPVSLLRLNCRISSYLWACLNFFFSL